MRPFSSASPLPVVWAANAARKPNLSLGTAQNSGVDDVEKSAQPVLSSAPIPLSTPPTDYHASFLIPLFVVFNALCWPWIIFGYVWFNDGIAAYQSVATYVNTHGQNISYLATLTGSIFAALTTFLFSFSIIRFSQKWFAQRSEVDVFDISFFMTLRYQFFPWTWKDFLSLLSRWYLIVAVAMCIFAFNLIPSGISAIVTPIQIQKVVPLNGSELDLGSQNPQCIEWLRTHPSIVERCGWFDHNGFVYTSCLDENQLIDALESGRNNILSYDRNNNQSQVFSELGGLQFVTPIRGVLPIGSDGTPGFDNLSSLPLPDSRALARSSSYDYSLELQGIDSNIHCEYDTSSPINFNIVASSYLINGLCPEGQQDFLGQPNYLTILSHHAFGFWACGNGSRDADGFQSYVLYLAGHDLYNTTIANITCSLSMQAATYNTTYHKQSGTFSTSRTSKPPSTLPSLLIDQAVKGLGALVPESQGFFVNSMAESVLTLGTKFFNLPTTRKDGLYPRLFEAMLLGVLEYQTTYARLIYTSYSTSPPPACFRTVDGLMVYKVVGWRYSARTIAFLLPVTFINLASFIILIIAMFMGEKVFYFRDPTDLRAFFMTPSDAPPESRGRIKVDLHGEQVFTPTSERKSYFSEGAVSPTSVGETPNVQSNTL